MTEPPRNPEGPDSPPQDPEAPRSRKEGMYLHTYAAEPESNMQRATGSLGKLLIPMLALIPAAVVALWLALSGSPEPTAPVAVDPQPRPTAPRASPVASTVQDGPGFWPVTDPELAVPAGTEVTLASRARDESGAPVTGGTVVWTLESGQGTLDPDTTATDGQGLAQTTLILPEQSGEVMVTGRVEGTNLRPSRFRVIAMPGSPSQVLAIQGDGQSGRPSSLLPSPVAVRVTDTRGNPVPGVEVRFQVLTGGGGVAPTRARTDSTGRAETRWRLGAAAGAQQVAAMAPDAEEGALTFQATALAPPPSVPASGGGETTPAPGNGGSRPTAQAPTPRPAEEAMAPVTVARRAYAVGGSMVCALGQGAAGCRGSDDRGQRQPGETPELVAIATGVSHVCGLEPSGQAWCWGANGSGQLGDGSRTDRREAVTVSTDLRFSRLAAGLTHTCGLAGGGVAACWGRNLNGQLGDGSRGDRPIPQAVAGGASFRMLVAGWNHTCGLDAGGRALCWGSNDQGQLGDGSRLDRLQPTPGAGSFSTMAAGSGHTCGIRGGTVLCWGDNQFGQLGDGTTEDHAEPRALEGLPGPAVDVAAGAVHSCALLESGQLYCWGQNLHGQVGDGTGQNRSSPVAVGGDLRFSTLEAGGAVTCAFGREGGEFCWGLNQSGQLGDGTRTNRTVPTRVGG